MSAQTKISINTDSQVALTLFDSHVRHLSENERRDLHKDQKKFLQTYSNFLYVVQNPKEFQDIK